MKLKELKVNQKARIEGYERESGEYFHRILALGLIVGTPVILKRKSLFGGPVQLDVHGTSLVLRANEANLLNVKLVQEN